MAGKDKDDIIAFAEILQRYNDYLYNYLNKLAGDSAEDLLQETLLRASQNYSDLKDVANVKAWLFRIATNVAMDHFRSRRTELQCDDDECMEIPDTNKKDAEESFIIEEMNDCIGRVIGNIPYLYRVVMLLYHFEGLSIDEIASACDISPSAVKVRLYRGKEILKKSLNKACDFYFDSDSNLRCSEK
jgi:RNA polymerase sigma-70 factor (ECF subfamily)